MYKALLTCHQNSELQVGLYLVGMHCTFFLNILLHLFLFVTIVCVQNYVDLLNGSLTLLAQFNL